MKALIVLESEDLIVPTYSVRSLIFAEQSRRSKEMAASVAETGLELQWLEDQPHAGAVRLGSHECRSLMTR